MFKRLRLPFVRVCLRPNLAQIVTVESQIGVHLTPAECQLFETLARMVKEEKLDTTIRIAGGWVRDKLLKKRSSTDIDIALDNMTGQQFINVLNKWCVEKGLQSLRFGIIQVNPSKSKHLETASVNLENFSLDFVNLRTELYSVNSRIPVIQFGSPTEDALRRDLTINSLFYNIQTCKIEDWTGKGLRDLEDRCIRTPLSPLATLQDDPLRALRAIRFACRFDFAMTLDLEQACGDSTVLQALATKISRERVTAELEAMLMRRSHATRAVCLIHRLGLSSAVFRSIEEGLGHAAAEDLSSTAAMTLIALDVIKQLVHEDHTGCDLTRLKLLMRAIDNEDEDDQPRDTGSAHAHADAAAAMLQATHTTASSASCLTHSSTTNLNEADRAVLEESIDTFMLRVAVWSSGMVTLTENSQSVHPSTPSSCITYSSPSYSVKQLFSYDLKMSTKLAGQIGKIQTIGQQIVLLIQDQTKRGHEYTRLELGQIIRKAGPLWPQCVTYACAVMSRELLSQVQCQAKASLVLNNKTDSLLTTEHQQDLISLFSHPRVTIINGLLTDNQPPQSVVAARLSSDHKNQLVQIGSKIEKLLHCIEVMQLQDVWKSVPLINGHELLTVSCVAHMIVHQRARVINMPRQMFPWLKAQAIGEALEQQRILMLLHPQAGRDEIVKLLTQQITATVT